MSVCEWAMLRARIQSIAPPPLLHCPTVPHALSMQWKDEGAEMAVEPFRFHLPSCSATLSISILYDPSLAECVMHMLAVTDDGELVSSEEVTMWLHRAAHVTSGADSGADVRVGSGSSPPLVLTRAWHPTSRLPSLVLHACGAIDRTRHRDTIDALQASCFDKNVGAQEGALTGPSSLDLLPQLTQLLATAGLYWNARSFQALLLFSTP